MEEATGNAFGATEEVTTPQNDVTTVPEETATPEKDGDSGTPALPEITEKPKGAEPSAAERRIKQLVAEKHARDREISRLKGLVEGKGISDSSQTMPHPVAPVGPTAPPQAKDFTDYDDYLVAKAAHKIKMDQVAEEQARQAKEFQTSMEVINNAFNERIDADSENNPDITKIRDRVGMRISPAVGLAIKQSESAPDLIRYLDANPGEISRLSGMNPIAAAKEIGRIEMKLSSNEPTKVKTVAPAPVIPTSKGSESVVAKKNDDEKPMDDYMKDFRSRGRKR